MCAEIKTERISDYRKRWAVIAGVKDYSHDANLPDLKNAVNDACLMHQILTGEYSFTSKLLCRHEDIRTVRFEPEFDIFQSESLEFESVGNGSRSDIIDAIDDISKVAAPDDLFVFFYSGHGTDEDKGFMVPFGSIRNQHATYLMYEEFFGVLTSLPCRHKVLIFDCCYAGISTKSSRDLGRVAESLPSDARTLPIHLAEQQCVIAATDAFTVTPDAFQSFKGNDGRASSNSPFTFALAKKLISIEKGEGVIPQNIYLSVFDEVTKNLFPALEDGTPVQPRIFEPGKGFIVFFRPGITIELPDRISVSAGSRITEYINASGGSPPYEWTIDNTVPDGIELEQHGQGTMLVVDINISAEVDVALRVRDNQGKSSTKDIKVFIHLDEIRPPQIITAQIPPCIIGRDYFFQLQADGGKAPLSWDVSGLPHGLAVSQHGELRGMIRKGEKNLATDQNDRVSHVIQITVRDGEDQTDTRTLRFVTVDPAVYCEVPAGVFLSGYHPSPLRNTEIGRLKIQDYIRELSDKFYPPGKAFLPRYFIKKYPVTNREWKAFIENNPECDVSPSKEWENGIYDENKADLPVTNINYNNIVEYCRHRGARLPAGREWEKAARGIDGRIFPWGERFSHDYCNCRQLNWGDITPVDQFPHAASPYGVMDMEGNVFEHVRHRIHHKGGWKQMLQGSCYGSYSTELLSCVGSHPNQGMNMIVDRSRGELEPEQNFSSPLIGFRDVIDVEDAPSYPQGFVRLDKCRFKSPHTKKLIITSGDLYPARYAVSNEEYAEFVKAENQLRPSHWGMSGEEMFVFEMRYYPVVNVSFEDAGRFCEWKSKQLGVKCMLIPLPVWQASVHGPGEMKKDSGFTPRLFPWGNNFDHLRCNSRESGWGGPARVFDMPDGRSQCGAYNLIGNVAEWAGPDIVFGGSWVDECNYPGQWIQHCNGPRYDVGFRYYTQSLPDESVARYRKVGA